MRKSKELVLEIQYHRIKFWKCLYTLKWTLSAMRLLLRYHSIDFMKMSKKNLNSCISGVETAFTTTLNREIQKREALIRIPMSEVMGTTEDLTVFLLFDASKSIKCNFYTKSTKMIPDTSSFF